MLTSNSSSQFSLALISSLPSGRRRVRPVRLAPFGEGAGIPFAVSVQVFDHFDAYRSRIDVPESIFAGGEVCPLLRHFARIVEQLHDVFAFGSFALDIEQNSPEFFRVGYTEFGSHRVVLFPVDVHEGFCGDQQRISAPGFHAALIVHSRIFSVSCVKWSGIRLVLRGLVGVFFPSCPSGWEGLFKEGGSGFAPLTGSSSRICSSTIALLSTIANGIEKANLMCFSGLTVPDGVTLTENGFGNFSSGSPLWAFSSL